MDQTVADEKIAGLLWSNADGKCHGRTNVIDGSLHHCNLITPAVQQLVEYKGPGELGLLERAHCDFSLCVPPRGITVGNSRILHLTPGLKVRQCTKLSARFICNIASSVGTIVLVASYEELVIDANSHRRLLRLPPTPTLATPPPPSPPRGRPPPERRLERVAERERSRCGGRGKREIDREQVRDTGEDLVGQHFYDVDLGMCKVVKIGEYNCHRVLWYVHKKGGEEAEDCSSVAEVRSWCNV